MLALLNAKGQTASTLSGKLYITDPDLKKFAGQWSYTSHDTVFTIDLKYEQKHIKNKSNDTYIDVIQGDYTLQKGGRVVLTSIGKSREIYTGSFFDKKANNNKITLLLYDIVKKKSGDVTFELLDNGKTASWKLQITEGVRLGKIDYTFSVPRKGLMKRVK
jgi:cell division protein YceG involved in septum cleavage